MLSQSLLQLCKVLHSLAIYSDDDIIFLQFTCSRTAFNNFTNPYTIYCAARNSVFDINDAAPARHTGTITYIFIPQ